jgi:hypothetical protein
MKQLTKRVTKLERQIKPEQVARTIRVVFVDSDGTETGFKDFKIGGYGKPAKRR